MPAHAADADTSAPDHAYSARSRKLRACARCPMPAAVSAAVRGGESVVWKAMAPRLRSSET